MTDDATGSVVLDLRCARHRVRAGVVLRLIAPYTFVQNIAYRGESRPRRVETALPPGTLLSVVERDTIGLRRVPDAEVVRVEQPLLSDSDRVLPYCPKCGALQAVASAAVREDLAKGRKQRNVPRVAR